MLTLAIAAAAIVSAFAVWRISAAWKAVRSGQVIFDHIEANDLARTRGVLETRPSAVNVRDSDGNTPLHAAAAVNAREIANFLLNHGADVNARRDNGASPVHLAAHSGHADMVELLLLHGANPNAKAARGLTPLHMAAAAGHCATAVQLLARGADPSAVDDWGKTPSNWAAEGHHLDLLDALA